MRVINWSCDARGRKPRVQTLKGVFLYDSLADDKDTGKEMAKRDIQNTQAMVTLFECGLL